jgi:hypothetical protein
VIKIHTDITRKVIKMTTSAETITVAGHFGDKEVTKKQFVKEWVDHAKQFMLISHAPSWQSKVADIMQEVGQAADDEFTAKFIEKQNGIS